MSIQFVIGRSGSGKSHRFREEIIEKSINNPEGPSIVYLVPDQMTFQSEYEFISNGKINGLIRAQVFSFTRLALRVLQETGGIAKHFINQTGTHLIFRKIIEERKEQLRVYKSVAEQKGFFDQVETLISEFKRYCITPEHLKEMIDFYDLKDRNAEEEMLFNKLFDIELIMNEYERYTYNQYSDSEDYLKFLEQKISKSQYLKDAEVYIDGFHSFTPQELNVIGALFKHCKKVSVALTLDQPYNQQPHELHLFQMTAKTFDKLKNVANELEVEIEETVCLHETAGMRFNNQALKQIELNFDERASFTEKSASDIQIISAMNRRAEIESLAKEMLELVREKGYRWRDFLILLRNNNDYQHLIETIFKDFEIPVFFDQKRSMNTHPLIEALRSVLDIILGNWQYEPVFRLIKTELIYPLNENNDLWRDRMDRLENYVLAYGIQGFRWKDQKYWTYNKRILNDGTVFQSDADKKIEKELRGYQSYITKPILKLHEDLKNATFVREKCEALFHFLMELQIPQKIERLRDDEEGKGLLIEAREHEQVYRAVIDLLDQIVEIMGNETISLDLFRKIIDSGLESLRFALVPPSLDQVLVGNVDHSRFLNVKCSFIIGANDGVLPGKKNDEGMITETERELLTIKGLELAPNVKQNLIDENFIIYLALSSPSDHLWVSYPMADEEGKALMPSPIIKRLKDMFTNVKVRQASIEIEDHDEMSALQYITHPGKTVSNLSLVLQNWKKGYPISTAWWDAYNWFITQKAWHARINLILNSLYYSNQSKPLDEPLSIELYGQELDVSVSRMERFMSCGFSQFAAYGLKLREREVFKLEAPAIGELYHAALKMTIEYLQNNGLSWADLTDIVCRKLTIQIVNDLAPYIQKEILNRSKRFEFIKGKLQNTIYQTVKIISNHGKRSEFVPVGLEVGFGHGEKIPPIQFKLNNGRKMNVIGRIDRVDKVEHGDDILLRIIDYKSSETDLMLDAVYHGLSLQMLTYLDVVVSHSKEWLGKAAKPAGVLYFHVHNPLINKAYIPTVEEIEKEIFKKYKMKGLIIADKEIILKMDDHADGQRSEVIPVGLKKNDEFYATSSIASEEDFSYLNKFVRGKIRDIGNSILDGQIEINPYKRKNNVACTFCPFQSVCQFDPMLKENDYRYLESKKADEVFREIRDISDNGGEMNE